MKTNRQWLESLTDKQLAEFLTFGLLVRSVHFVGEPFMICISQIAMRYTASIKGIEKWLSDSQDYEIVKGE
jgi:hypothetical protein